MSVVLEERLITVEEYYRMAEVGILGPDEKVELINGKIINMSPIGSKHAYCVKQLNKIFIALFGDTHTIGIQDPIRLSDLSEPEPDLSLALGPDSKYIESHPSPSDILLLIEVADSSVDEDRDVKIPLYASSGIPECWIVNIPENKIEVYKSPKHNTYQLKEEYLPGQSISLQNLKATIQVNQILP